MAGRDNQQNNLELDLAIRIVSAYVSNNPIPASDLPALILGVSQKVRHLHGVRGHLSGPIEPTVPIENSVRNEYLVCLEDGMRFRALKRHLRLKHGLTPDEYRFKWSLPNDYPMVAPAYAKAQSALAKKQA